MIPWERKHWIGLRIVRNVGGAPLDAARRYLVDLPEVDGERIGAIGFCMGGGLITHADLDCVDERQGPVTSLRTSYAPGWPGAITIRRFLNVPAG